MKVLVPPRRWKMLHLSVCEAAQAKRRDTVASMDKVTHGVSFAALALLYASLLFLKSLLFILALRFAPGNRTQSTSSFCFSPHLQVEVWMWEALMYVCVLEKGTFSPRRAPDCLTQRSQTVYIISVNQSCAPRHVHAFRLCVTKTHLRDFTKLCLFKGVWKRSASADSGDSVSVN